MQKSKKIALYDSGIGGLTVLAELVRLLPNENYIYFGDGKNCPLGEKKISEVIEATDYAVDSLIKEGVKLIVIACNTATSIAKDHLRAKYDIDIVGMEPAIKPALKTTKSGVIGVLATQNTIEGKPLHELCKKWQDNNEILFRVGNGLVEMVESNSPLTDNNRKVIKEHIEWFIDRGADKIVLGCTHYPFLEQEFKKIIGSRDIEIINPAKYIATRVDSILTQKGLKSSNSKGNISFVSRLDEDYNLFIKNKFVNLLDL